MIFVTSFEPAGKGKCRVAFDNGIKCLLYRGEAAVFFKAGWQYIGRTDEGNIT